MEHKTITRIASIALLIIAVILFSSACKKDDDSTSKTQQVPDIKKNSIPQYEIETSDCRKPFKCSYDIRIENTLSKEELTLIGNQIKKNSPTVENNFIAYYLPCMKIGSGAWATSHFNPTLSVSINEFILPSNPTCLEDIQDAAEKGFFKDDEVKAFFKALEKITITNESSNKIQDDCFSKFKKYAKQDSIEIDRLKPLIDLWTIEISFNYRYDLYQSTYQYSCLYTKRGELLTTSTIDKKGMNQTSTPLQEKYNF